MTLKLVLGLYKNLRFCISECVWKLVNTLLRSQNNSNKVKQERNLLSHLRILHCQKSKNSHNHPHYKDNCKPLMNGLLLIAKK